MSIGVQEFVDCSNDMLIKYVELERPQKRTISWHWPGVSFSAWKLLGVTSRYPSGHLWQNSQKLPLSVPSFLAFSASCENYIQRWKYLGCPNWVVICHVQHSPSAHKWIYLWDPMGALFSTTGGFERKLSQQYCSGVKNIFKASIYISDITNVMHISLWF